MLIVLVVLVFIIIKTIRLVKDDIKETNTQKKYISIADKYMLIQKLREMHPRDFERFIEMIFKLY